MEIKAFRLDDNSRLTPIGVEGLSTQWLSDEVPRWIDVEAPKADKLSDILTPLGVPQPIIENGLKPTEEPELFRYENLIYIEFPHISKNHDLKRTYVSIIFLPTILVTIRIGRISSINVLDDIASIESKFHSSSISGLLYELFVYLIQHHTYQFFQDVRTQINNLSNSINEKPDSVEQGDILTITRLVDLFITTSEDQIYCIESLLASESKLVQLGDQRQYFKDLNRSVENGIRILNRYDGRVNYLHQHYMLTLQEKANNRLRVLTIISAIFLPLTLIAGIYGMNFEFMPELDNHYSYFIVLGVMLVMALVMLFFFYLRGWFK